MSRHYVSCLAQCPFYLEEDRTVIYCEGIEAGSRIHNSFGSESERAQAYKKRYCQNHWEQCRIAKMLNDGYK